MERLARLLTPMEGRWPHITIPMTWEQFRLLPPHPAYRYEYSGGSARLTPRPIYYHAVLSLAERRCLPEADAEQVVLRPLQPTDWTVLPRLFSAAFREVVPFAMLPDRRRLAAVRDCLDRTRGGGDGPVVDGASLVAVAPEGVCAALVVTLIPPGDLETFEGSEWEQRAPDDALAQCWGRPHLTWVFTAPGRGRRGLASALLDGAAGRLLHLGYRELASTILLGNEPSVLWHWRNGFRLLPYVASPSRLATSPQRTTPECTAGD